MKVGQATRLKSFFVVSALAGLLGAGCSGGGTSNPCEGIQNVCPTEGLHKCSGEQIQTCGKNADGCLVWGAAADCGALQTCQATGADASCRCDNQCPQAGDTQCSSDTIQTCTANGAGCLAWVDGEDCSASGKYCDDTAEPAVCSENCVDHCTQEGDTRCNGDVVEGCAKAASGCLDWIPGANCADAGQICSDASGTAGCYAPCTDDCDTVDATRCQGEAVQTCRVGNDGCRAWVVTTNCADNSQYCVESGGSASCSDTCQDRCPAADDTRCADDTTVQTCATAASGCLDWQKTDECSLPRTKCQVAEGTAQCVQQCQDVCDPAVDDSQCHGTVRQACQVVAASGCYDWVDLEDCATNGGFCDNTVDPVACADKCTNECDTIDAKRCDPFNRVIQICAAGTDGCNDWVTDSDCTASSQVCYDGSGLAKCIDPCTSECSTAGATRCNADDSAVETCETNTANGCNYWNVTTTCAEPTPLCDDSGAEAACVCTDQCDSDGATQCSGSVIQVCAQDGDSDSCLEWKDTTDCTDANPTDTCDASSGTAQCVCTDECSPGDTACNGNTLQTCVSDGDNDTCLELADTTDCTQGGTSTDVCATDANGDAACVCSDECPADGNTRCDANFAWIQTCVTDADNDSCLEWQDTTDCTQGGTSTDVCDASGGAAQCVATCTNDCDTVGVSRCGNDGINPTVEECQVGTDTCRHWTVIATCSGDTPACDDSSQPAQCICVDECPTLGGTCNGNVPENCVSGTDGCNDLVAGSACTAAQVCEVYDNTAQCVDNCTEGLVDGSFEEVTTNNTWTATSTLFGSPMCDATCTGGIANFAFDGQWWIWVGGGNDSDEVDVSQQINIPVGRQTQLFFLMLVSPAQPGGSASEITEVLVDNSQVWAVDTTDPAYWGDYQLASVDLSSYADGQDHTLDFHSVVGAQTSVLIDYAGLQIGSYEGNTCCWNTCQTEGQSHCDGDVPNTCIVGTSGCLEWSASAACTDPTPFCDDSSGSAQCVAPITCTNDLGSAVNPDASTPVATGSNTGGTDSFALSCSASSGGLDVCYTWTAPADGAYDINTLGSNYDTVLAIYEGIDEIACNNDTSSVPQSQIIRQFTAGEQVVIVIDGEGSANGNYELNIIAIPPETTCDDFADNDYDDLPDCADPTDCQTLAVCNSGSAAAGSPCTANSDCSATANDPACLTDAMGFGNGYCSEWCVPGSDDCPAGSLCMDVGLPGIGLCYDACDPAAPDCRTDTWTDPDSGDNCSYACIDLGGGQGVCSTQCVPSCAAIDLGTFTGAINLTNQDSCSGSTSYDFNGCNGQYGWGSDGGSELVYQLVVPAGTSVTITQTGSASLDSILWVTSDCVDINGAQCMGASDETTAGGAETVTVPAASTDQTIFIVADAWSGCGTFTLDIQ